MLRRFGLLVGALAIVAAFFFATLFFIDNYRPKADTPAGRNAIRARHVEQIKTALESYRKKENHYPLLPDNEVDDLKKYLVDGGYLASIPADPSKATAGRQYRYASVDGSSYGLLIKTETATGAVEPCLAGPPKRGYWANPPVCSFWKPS